MLAQAETESFWSDAGDWLKDAGETVASGVTGATVYLGTEKAWNSIGNGIADASEAALEQVVAMGAETPI